MGYKLLLADDSITIQKVVSIIFANEDYDLTVVDNGKDTLDKAREIMPDVILVDALMPGKSGYDVCMEVRQDPALKHIPLLLLVGAFEPFDEEKAARSGADEHISKPFESQFLIEKVKKLVDIGKERAAAQAPAGTEALASVQQPEAMNTEDERYSVNMSSPEPSRLTAIDKPAVEVSPLELSLESMEVVEVTPEDDLWGAFEVAEIVEGEDVRLDEIVEGDRFEPEIIDTVEEMEPFVFTEEEQSAAAGENTISLGEFPDTPQDDFAESEESFVFREEPEFEEFAAPGSTFQTPDFTEPSGTGVGDEQGEVAIEEGYRAFGETTTSTLDAFAAKSFAEQTSIPEGSESGFADEEKFEFQTDILSGGSAGQSADVTKPGIPGNISLNEEQLAAILANVSREIIEKIAWEVVPDLAESIIREEIRKIKEGL